LLSGTTVWVLRSNHQSPSAISPSFGLRITIVSHCAARA
jgi:hypothetical protein